MNLTKGDEIMARWMDDDIVTMSDAIEETLFELSNGRLAGMSNMSPSKRHDADVACKAMLEFARALKDTYSGRDGVLIGDIVLPKGSL